MFTRELKPLIAVCALAMGLNGIAAQAADKDQGSDVWSKAAITTTYTLNRHLNPFNIDVDVENGVAILRGHVESDVERDLAEELALGVDGVKEVRNELEVNPDTPTQAESGSFMSNVRDANITAKVKSQLLWNRNTHGIDIDVDTESSIVTLTGGVKSNAESQLAEQIARNTSDVMDVNNRLTVADGAVALDDKVEREAEQTKQEVSDSWITTKVKSALIYNRNIEMGEIDVTTKNGVVRLKGSVDSDVDKQTAVAIAKGIRGVKDVKADLKVLPQNT